MDGLAERVWKCFFFYYIDISSRHNSNIILYYIYIYITNIINAIDIVLKQIGYQKYGQNFWLFVSWQRFEFSQHLKIVVAGAERKLRDKLCKIILFESYFVPCYISKYIYIYDAICIPCAGTHLFVIVCYVPMLG